MTTRASLSPVKWHTTRYLAALTVLLTACGFADIPSEERHPDVIGVVESIEPLGGTEHLYRLESGEQLTLDSNDVDAIAGSVLEGALMLYGEDAGGAWYVGAAPRGDCYELVGPAEFRGEFGDGRMVFESGLSLPLAIDFSPGRPSDPRVSERAHICVDEDGKVLSYSTT